MDFSALPEGTEPLAIGRVPAGLPKVRFAPVVSTGRRNTAGQLAMNRQ
jgi:hypothetical protein